MLTCVPASAPSSCMQAHSQAGGESAQAASAPQASGAATRAGDPGLGAASRVPFPAHGHTALQVRCRAAPYPGCLRAPHKAASVYVTHFPGDGIQCLMHQQAHRPCWSRITCVPPSSQESPATCLRVSHLHRAPAKARAKNQKVYCSRGEGEGLVQEPLWLAWALGAAGCLTAHMISEPEAVAARRGERGTRAGK